jgi:hypothetical protein
MAGTVVMHRTGQPVAAGRRRRPGRGRLNLPLLLLLLALTACSDDDPSTRCPEAAAFDWQRLDVDPETVNALALVDDRLFVAGGVSGLEVQTPALCGDFINVGERYPELHFYYPTPGVSHLAMADGVLYRAYVGVPGHDIVTCGDPAAPESSAPCVEGTEPRRPNDLVALPSGAVLLGTTGQVYRKAPGDATWAPTQSGIFTSTALSRGPGVVVYLAENESNRLNRFFRSTNDGLRWTRITPDWPGEAPYDLVASLATSVSGDTVLATVTVESATDARVLLSTDAGASFRTILTAPRLEFIGLEPREPHRLIAIGNALHLSRDLGTTWEVHTVPGRPIRQGAVLNGQPLGQGAVLVDWDHDRIIVGRLGRDHGEVWWTALGN